MRDYNTKKSRPSLPPDNSTRGFRIIITVLFLAFLSIRLRKR